MKQAASERTRILWRLYVWNEGAWKSWSGTSGDVRLSGVARDRDAENKTRGEFDRLSKKGWALALVRLGTVIENMNLDKLKDGRAAFSAPLPKEND